MMSEIEYFKGRNLDESKSVQVYRNLTRKGRWYSIRQSGKVIGHTTELTLTNAEFVVKDKPRQQVLKTGRRQVHAWVQGHVATFQMIPEYNPIETFWVEYNPFKYTRFVIRENQSPIRGAKYVYFDDRGLYATYVIK